MSDDELKDIRARRAKITAARGRWKAAEGAVVETRRKTPVARFVAPHDAEFIAHAPEDIDALLTEVERLTAESKGYHKALVAKSDELRAEWLRAERAEAERDALRAELDAVDDAAHGGGTEHTGTARVVARALADAAQVAESLYAERDALRGEVERGATDNTAAIRNLSAQVERLKQEVTYADRDALRAKSVEDRAVIEDLSRAVMEATRERRAIEAALDGTEPSPDSGLARRVWATMEALAGRPVPPPKP